MTDQELIDYAYENYKLGEIFISIVSGEEFTIRKIEPYNEYSVIRYAVKESSAWNYDKALVKVVYLDDGLSTKYGGCSNPAIYIDGVWAPIVTEYFKNRKL